MTTRETPWPQGTPSWVDLMVPDAKAAGEFYDRLFGWQIQDLGEEAGGYTMALLSGRPVAGIGPVPEGQDLPSVWTTYIAVDDVDAIVTKVTGSGGQVLMPAMDVLAAGRMAVVADSTGAVFGLWQAGEHKGAEIVNEPGALTWNECMTRGYDEARKFYADVFGYQLEDVGDGGFKYSVLNLAGSPVGGLGELGADMPAEVPPHWMAYFAVANTDDTLERATALGAQVRMQPQDTPYGRMAVLEGAQGEIFAVIAG
jgi:uncharacterized protein